MGQAAWVGWGRVWEGGRSFREGWRRAGEGGFRGACETTAEAFMKLDPYETDMKPPMKPTPDGTATNRLRNRTPMGPPMKLL